MIPGTLAVSSVQVGVEDGDIDNYSLLQCPPGWQMTILPGELAHDIGPALHGETTPSVGSCPYILKFSKGSAGSPQGAPFDLAYSYDLPTTGHHDVGWIATGGQAQWAFASGTNRGPIHSPARMNVLMIVLDDVGADFWESFDDPDHLGAHPFAVTRHLDDLADEGIRFTNFYVNPVCSTTRACLQTGRYAFRHKIGGLPGVELPALEDCEMTIAELLKYGFPASQRPYATGAFGKWHLTLDISASCPSFPGLASFAGHPARNGYDRFSGTLVSQDAYDWESLEYTAPGAIAHTCETQWSADVVRENAKDWIRSRAEPFFAWVAFNPPHDPLRLIPSATPSPCPGVSGNAFLTSLGPPRPLLSCETESALYSHAVIPDELGYRALIEAIDSEVRYLLDDIGEQRLRNTMVFVICDNGTPGNDSTTSYIDPQFHDPDHGKETVYQIGVRVPMFVKGPLASPGTCAAAVGGVDLWKTIADITGADVTLALGNDPANPCADPGLDSTSLLPLIEDPSGNATKLAFSQGFMPPGTDFDCKKRHARALTDGTYKYLRIQDEKSDSNLCDAPVFSEEFYNVENDPEEQFNLLEGAMTPGASSALLAMRVAMDSPEYGGF